MVGGGWWCGHAVTAAWAGWSCHSHRWDTADSTFEHGGLSSAHYSLDCRCTPYTTLCITVPVTMKRGLIALPSSRLLSSACRPPHSLSLLPRPRSTPSPLPRRPFTSPRAPRSAMSSAVTKIVRFQTTDGTTHLGEPIPGTEDAHILTGDLFTPSSLQRTGAKAAIGRYLTPFDPVSMPCVGLNYKDHAHEANMDLPKNPMIFHKNIASAPPLPSPPLLCPLSALPPVCLRPSLT